MGGVTTCKSVRPEDLEGDPRGKTPVQPDAGALNYTIAHFCTFCDNRANKPYNETPTIEIRGEEHELPLCRSHERLVSEGFHV